MSREVSEYVDKLNINELETTKKKHKTDTQKLKKEADAINEKIRKFNEKHSKTKANFYPALTTSAVSINWKTHSPTGIHGSVIAGPNSYGHTALSKEHKELKNKLTRKVETFILQLQLQEAAITDMDKFLQKLLK
jgi:hypothetical protein